MSYETFLSDRRKVRDRGDWLVEFYPKDPDGVEQTLRFSRRGSATGSSAIVVGDDTLPAHTIYRKRIIKTPTLTQSIWSPGLILSRSIPSFGSCVLTNEDGGLDQYHPDLGWQWSGCRYKVFFGDKLNLTNTLGRIGGGIMGEPKFDLSQMEVPLQGFESLFDVDISERVYRGTSYGLELFGDKTTSYGTPAAVNLRNDMAAETWMWLEALPSAAVGFWGWTDDAKPWALGMNSNGTLRIAGSIGGSVTIISTTKALSTLRFYHISFIIDDVDLVVCIWDDDVEEETIETYISAFSGATRDTQAGSYMHRSGSDATFKPWFDESRVWNVARSLDNIRANRFRPLAGNVPAECVHCVGFDDGSGTTATDSSATAANGTISGAGTHTWLWMHEGGPELAGTPKPDVWGERFGCKPVLIDGTGVNGAAGYQVAGGGLINDIDSFEGGLIHTSTSAASFRAYITTAPVAGLFSGQASLQYLPRGLFKLGASPTLPVSATVKGYSGGSLGYVNKGGTITRDIVTRRGPELIDPTELDTSSFTSYATANPGIIGIFLPSPKKISEVLDFIMASGAGWWGYVRASTLFHIEQFSGPGATPDYTFDKRNIVTLDPMPPLQVIYKVIVKYRENNVVLSEDQVAASVKSSPDWQKWTKQWLEEPASDDGIRADYPGAASVPFTVETGLQYAADARALAAYLLALLKGPKRGWMATVTLGGALQATIGQTSAQDVELQRDRPRLGLDGTQEYAIISAEDNRQEGTVRVGQWG